MRKIVALITTVLLVVLTGCGSSSDDNTVVIYTAAEEERISYLQSELDKEFPDYEIIFQSLGTGNLVTKLQAEGTGTDCDIFYDLETANAQILLESDSDLFYDLSQNFDYSIYLESVVPPQPLYAVNGKTDGAIVVNRAVLEENGCPVPETYEDLLDPCYKGLISMPNPKSSGTGYAFYNGRVSSIGLDAAIEYFTKLDSNIKEYTTSGSAPIKALDRGEIAIGVCMLWQAVQYANENEDLEVIFLDNEASYNLFAMGIINGKQEKPAVMDVFTYLYNNLNPREAALFTPDQIYKEQGASGIPNYPQGFAEIEMQGQFDPAYKQSLLDAWVF